MSIPFNRKYKLERSENFDEFLKELGVNFVIRKMASSTTSTVELVKEGDNEYSFNTISSFRTQSIKFQPGVEFIENRMDGEEVPCIITFDGNKMIQEQKGRKPITMVRTFTDDELYLTIKIGDLEARRWFKAC
ncbi:fatty acid-binding protein-like [Chironomus tepperi]|uniref:fatty acid-binding protein-like n=1 Tax=Chironomus tepperi TaxID=113505 RepID=UPI00391FBD45